MSLYRKCKRGNLAEMDKWGSCTCIDCKKYRAAINSKWYIENKDKKKESSRKWKDGNIEKVKGYVKKWRNKYPEKYKESQNKSHSKWYSSNKGTVNALNAKRRAAKSQRTPKWADMSKIRAFYLEAARLTKETGIKHEVDHIIPLQGEFISGLHVHQNLQILTKSQNCSKRNRVEGLL